jgi:hypothetical protein
MLVKKWIIWKCCYGLLVAGCWLLVVVGWGNDKRYAENGAFGPVANDIETIFRVLEEDAFGCFSG